MAHREDIGSQSAMNQSPVARTDSSLRQNDRSLPRSQTQEPGAQGNADEPRPEAQDPLAHMSDMDRWGLKGFSFMMNNFPDYAALVTGSEISTLGFDLNTSE